jgi:hypothetical protein
MKQIKRPNQITGEFRAHMDLPLRESLVGHKFLGVKLTEESCFYDVMINVCYEAYYDSSYGSDRDGLRGTEYIDITDFDITSISFETTDGKTHEITQADTTGIDRLSFQIYSGLKSPERIKQKIISFCEDHALHQRIG